MILVPESEFSISWVLLFNTVARAYIVFVNTSSIFCLLVKKFCFYYLNLLKKNLSFQKRQRALSFAPVEGLFPLLPLSKASLFYCPCQRALSFIALTCGVDHILNDWLSGGFAWLFGFLFIHFFHFFLHIKPSLKSSGAYRFTNIWILWIDLE